MKWDTGYAEDSLTMFISVDSLPISHFHSVKKRETPSSFVPRYYSTCVFIFGKPVEVFRLYSREETNW